ncbi:MAG: NupC/NupG family nucleoside CNT transporter [Endomicrobia bacterium]|nr:NupC/NupG family nucleoside CNT transporter [Endomicrobiia bacterium]
MKNLVSLFGMLVLIAIGWLLSEDKKRILWRTILWGTLLQIILGLIVLKTPPGRWFFEVFNKAFIVLVSFSERGAEFIFGELVTNTDKFGYIFAFKVLPTIIFFSAFISILYYFGVMQFIVELFARIMVRTMGTSGAESLCCSANVFVGQTEAPLLVRPYVKDMTRSELLAVMTGGMATIAGGVMAAYVSLLKNYIPDIAGHLMTASVMSAPAALVFSKLLVPETEEPKTLGHVKVKYEKTDVNVIDAVANGTTVGLRLAVNVGAMLISFMALLYFANYLLSTLGNLLPFEVTKNLSFDKLFGLIFAPISWLLGVDSKDIFIAGNLIGQKTFFNEFVAYANWAHMYANNPQIVTHRTAVILSYALCGFSNFLSIGIQIGGIGAIAPERKHDLARLGIKSLIAGTLACLQTATVAGILLTK